MPRAIDLLTPTRDHDPLANLLDFTGIDQTVATAGMYIKTFIEGILDGVVLLIKDLTGLDLSSLAGVLEGIDLSSPEAFIQSLVAAITQLPDVLVTLIESLINMLISSPDMFNQMIDPVISMLTTLPDMLVGLLTVLIDMLTTSPDTLQTLLESLIGLLVSLPEVLINLLNSLVDMLNKTPDILITLLEALIGLLIDLPELLLNLGEALLSSGAGLLGTLSPLDSGNLFGLIPGGLIPGLDGSKLVSGTIGASLLQPLIDSISVGFGGPTGLDFGGLFGFLDAIPGVGPVIDTFVNTFLNMGGSGFDLTDLTRSLQSIPMSFLTGSMAPGQISHLNIGTLSNALPEFLVNPNFDSANSIAGQGTWMFDGTTGPPGVSTSVFANADGTLKELFSNPIATTGGQVLNIFGSTSWSGFTGGANSIALTVAKFDGSNTLTGYDTIGAIASPGSSGGWTLLSNPAYTVPAGIASIVLRPIVTPGASAGRVAFGKLSVKPTATTLPNPLVGLLDASKIGSGQFAQSFVAGLSTMFSGLVPTAPIPSQLGISNLLDLQVLNDHITNALIGTGSQFVDSSIPQARGSLDSIFDNLLSNTATLQALIAAQTTTGINVSINFSNYPDGPLPSNFTVTYSGAGISTIGVTSGDAGWRTLVNDANRTANIVFNTGPSNTDYQVVKGTMASPPTPYAAGGLYIYAILRVDNPANPQNYVWARAYALAFGQYRADVGCTIAGVETVWQSGITLTWSMDITVKAGVSGNPRRYQAYSGTTLVYDATEPGTASQLGAGFRYWGARNTMKAGSGGPYSAGSISATSVIDGS